VSVRGAGGLQGHAPLANERRHHRQELTRVDRLGQVPAPRAGLETLPHIEIPGLFTDTDQAWDVSANDSVMVGIMQDLLVDLGLDLGNSTTTPGCLCRRPRDRGLRLRAGG
jgi:hypothetical protein